MTGFFVTKGMRLRISNLRLNLLDNSEPSSLEMQLSYDACSAWLRITLDHLTSVKNARTRRNDAWRAEDPKDRGDALEDEFSASIQAIVAAASAMDALYAQIVTFFPPPDSLRDSWKKNRTARAIQISEVLRVNLRLNPEEASSLRGLLAGVFKLRDAAVHPNGRPQPAIHHLEIDVFTEWRFWAFRADVAEFIACSVAGLLWDISKIERKTSFTDSQFYKDFQNAIWNILSEGKPAPNVSSIHVWLP
jgi:hypothetical protein